MPELAVQQRRRSARALAGSTLVALFALVGPALDPAAATELPIGFVETQVADHLISPTAVTIAPDGRIFVAEQSGRVRLIKNGVLLTTPFLQVAADEFGERGLLGITLDPDFGSNHYVYVYYPPAGLGAFRLSRFTADGDVALPEETILSVLPPYTFTQVHFGGGLHFAPDGTLFLSVGDHFRSDQSPLLTSVFGKMLRLNADGGIPTDNPFFGSTSGLARAIWAKGLRNPFSFDIHPGTGRMFINDVGESSWEEINEGFPGADYGWPGTEGPTDDPAFVGPIYAYPHADNPVCAVTGAAFYAPEVPVFPPAYVDGFFFGDFCGRYVRYLATGNDLPFDFASGLPGNLTDVDVGPDGSLYYLVRTSWGDRQDDEGALYRISYTASLAPQITAHPESQTVFLGDPVSFVGAALEATAFQWQRDGVDIPAATTTGYSLPSVELMDDGVEFRLVATNEHGSTASRAAVLTVTTNQAPTASITVESPRELFFAGDLVQFSGTADDAEDGPLDAGAFTWRVDFHHGTHSHPFFPPTEGIATGEFTTASAGETSPDVWYRINLRVEDSEGRAFTTSEDVLPELATFTLETEPTGLQLTLDGQPHTAPHAVSGVVNLTRQLGAPDPQTLDGTTYRFERWSDAGSRQHAIFVPPGQTTYTAFFTLVTTTTSTTSTTTTSTTTSSTTTTLPPLGPYLLYDARRTPPAPRSHAFGPVTLEDELGSAGYDVLGPRQLGLPADANGEGTSEEASRLVEYELRPARGAPPFQERVGVPVANACTDLEVDVKRPVSLLVPAAEPGAAVSQHFLCYRARAPEGLAKLGIQVDVVDSFHGGRYELERITKLCNPVAISGGPVLLTGGSRGQPKPIEPAAIQDPSRHLTCYRAKLARRFIAQDGCGAADPNDEGTRIEPEQQAPAHGHGIPVNDAFGLAQLDTTAPRELCIPSAQQP